MVYPYGCTSNLMPLNSDIIQIYSILVNLKSRTNSRKYSFNENNDIASKLYRGERLENFCLVIIIFFEQYWLYTVFFTVLKIRIKRLFLTIGSKNYWARKVQCHTSHPIRTLQISVAKIRPEMAAIPEVSSLKHCRYNLQHTALEVIP